MDYAKWSEEAFEVAEDFCYEGIKEGVALSEDYLSEGYVLARKQVVIAGKRLAYLLQSLDLSKWRIPKVHYVKEYTAMSVSAPFMTEDEAANYIQ